MTVVYVFVFQQETDQRVDSVDRQFYPQLPYAFTEISNLWNRVALQIGHDLSVGRNLIADNIDFLIQRFPERFITLSEQFIPDQLVRTGYPYHLQSHCPDQSDNRQSSDEYYIFLTLRRLHKR